MDSIVENLDYDEIIEGNRKLHDQEARFYDVIHTEIWNKHEQRRIQKDLNFALSLVNAETALDFGCGTGNLAIKLLQAGLQVTAIDISPEMCRITRQKCNGNLRVLNVNVDEQMPDGKYDILTACSVLHHLPNYPATLKRLLSNVRDGGVVYITHEPVSFTKNYDGAALLVFKFECLIKTVISKIIGLTQHFDYSKSDVAPVNYTTLKRVLEESAFKPVQVYLYNLHIGFLPSLASRLRKPNTLSVVAQKVG